jgi:isoquinoline 1-oxidoreductase beta subunit
LRQAGAAARAVLIEAAASQWNIAPTSCTAADGEVIHVATGRKLAYGALADAAAKLTPPTNPPLKDRKDFKLIGKPAKRLDLPNKLNGTAVFGIDMLPAGVKFAATRQPGVRRQGRELDDTAAKACQAFARSSCLTTRRRGGRSFLGQNRA